VKLQLNKFQANLWASLSITLGYLYRGVEPVADIMHRIERGVSNNLRKQDAFRHQRGFIAKQTRVDHFFGRAHQVHKEFRLSHSTKTA
jgi:hypothetical protein